MTERRVFTIDVGSLNEETCNEYIERIKSEMLKRETQSKSTSE